MSCIIHNSYKKYTKYSNMLFVASISRRRERVLLMACIFFCTICAFWSDFTMHYSKILLQNYKIDTTATTSIFEDEVVSSSLLPLKRQPKSLLDNNKADSGAIIAATEFLPSQQDGGHSNEQIVPALLPVLVPSNNNKRPNHPLSTKIIQPGNHTYIHPPEKIIGPNGELGYVQDPKFLIKNPPPYQMPPNEVEYICRPPGQGNETFEGAKHLARIRKHIEISQASRNVTLFCAIYTINKYRFKTDAVSETWGKRCDGLLYASDVTNKTTGHVRLAPMHKRRFKYNGMFQRVRTMMAYIYDNYLDDFDYFHFGGEDVYMIVENMKEFLATDKVQQWEHDRDKYMIAGFWTTKKVIMKDGFFLNGGSGYTLSKKALKAYVEGPLQLCNTYDNGAMEDLSFSDCAHKFFSHENETFEEIFIDTRDESGAHRYHPATVRDVSIFPEIMENHYMKAIPWSLRQMNKKFGFSYVIKEDLISNSSVTFHRLKPIDIRRMEMMLYGNFEDDCVSSFVMNKSQQHNVVNEN